MMTISLLSPNRLALVFALTLIFVLTGCGSGGSNTRSSGSLTNVCTDPGADNTGAPSSCTYSYAKAANTCTDSRANNIGKPLPCTYPYTGQEKDNLLMSNGATAAHAEGFTGKGVTVGMVDEALSSSFDHTNMSYSPLSGKVLSYDTALTNIRFKKAEVEQNPHFLFAGSYLAARDSSNFSGGIAPNAQLRWFGACTDAIIACTHKQGDWKNYLQTLLNHGDVRLINASIAGPSGLHSGRYAAEWEPLLAYDALIVGSAGNEKKSQPAVEWQAPIVNTNHKFYGHMIVATSVHINTSTRSTNDQWNDGGNDVSTDPSYQLYRPSYANACGVAKDWCVSAVSNILLPRANNPNQLYEGAGTSGAAPIVTGVAALVMEAYPWMSALNIQQTVLTTATDIGEPGVDAIYGWGLVNAAKAVHGPAQFVKNRFIDGFTADFEGGSRPFSNDINGAGWLKKRGSGTLTLTGKNTYTGGTFVEAGTLRSSGSFASNIDVAPGATFMTLYDPQKPNKAVNITGDYRVHTASSWNAGKPAAEHKTGIATTAIQLGAPLAISGKATISSNNSRLLLLRENQGYQVKATETLITASQGLSGQFSEFSYGSNFFWTATLNYDNTSVSADLTRTSSAQGLAVSLNASAKVIEGAGMADALIRYTDKLVESGQTAGHEALLSATAKLMSAPDNDTATRSLSSLTGDIHSAARALGIQRAFDSGERLADRLRALGHRQQTGVWLQNASNNGQFSRLGYGDTQVQHSATGIGADALFGDRWTLGISAAQTASSAQLDHFGGRLNGIGQHMAVYARTQWGQQGYFSSLVSVDQHTVDTQRQVLAGDSLSYVSGQHTDRTSLFRLESGLNLKSGLSPYWATGTLSLRQSGFTESGLLGLSAESDTFTTEFAEIGTRFDRHLGRWTVAVNTSARRMFGSENGFNAAFAGAETAPFTIAGQALTGTRVRVGSDVSYHTVNGWQLSLALGTEHGNRQQRNTWSQASAKIGF